jgi:hypothetical protein
METLFSPTKLIENEGSESSEGITNNTPPTDNTLML